MKNGFYTSTILDFKTAQELRALKMKYPALSEKQIKRELRHAENDQRDTNFIFTLSLSAICSAFLLYAVPMVFVAGIIAMCLIGFLA